MLSHNSKKGLFLVYFIDSDCILGFTVLELLQILQEILAIAPHNLYGDCQFRLLLLSVVYLKFVRAKKGSVWFVVITIKQIFIVFNLRHRRQILIILMLPNLV